MKVTIGGCIAGQMGTTL